MATDLVRKAISPSRTYVAMCNDHNFDGYFFKKFELPLEYGNTPENASWYFLNVLDHIACIEKCISYENYCNISAPFRFEDSKNV